MRIRHAIVAAVLVLAAAAPAQAYQFICRSWTITGFGGSGCPSGFQDTDTCGCNTAGTAPKWFGGLLQMRVESQGGNGLTATQFVNASASAAESWTGVSGSSLVVTANNTFGAINTARWGNFNNNSEQHEIFYVTTENEWISVTGSGGGGTLGVTVAPWTSFGCDDRGFYDADILINGFIQGGWNTTAVEETILHEIGHAIGLGHPCLSGFAGCSNSCSAVMAASGGDFTTPQQDDFNGVSALYPGSPGGLGAACDSDFDCSGTRPCVEHQGFEYCSQTCTSTCPEGYECESKPEGQVCVRQGRPSVGDACTGSCADGATCLFDGDGGSCFENCNPANDNCPDGGRCVSLQSGGAVCFPSGTKGEGEVCEDFTECAAGHECLGFEGESVSTCFRLCEGAPESCGSQYTCIPFGGGADGGFCIPSVGDGADCSDLDVICEGGLICVTSGDSAICRRECDNAADCTEDETCESLSNDAAVCFPAGNAVEGDSCFSGSDCQVGLICVGNASGAECLVGCDPSSPFCPHPGQTCIGLQGSNTGVCDPAGGTGGACECDTNDACQASCICDPDCAPECTCNVSSGCDAGCGCDLDCSGSCTCDTSGACEVGCACDNDCACSCDSDSPGRCDLDCNCDPDCPCACDETYFCDPEDPASDTYEECACDIECPCECDTTTSCDAGCECDIDCAGGCSGCQDAGEETAFGFGLIVLWLGWRRRRSKVGTLAI